MKILVIGDANSIFVQKYIENVHKNPKDEIVLATHDSSKKDYNDFYANNNIKVEEFVKTGPLKKIPRIRTLIGAKLWGKKLKKKYGEFDLIHVHALTIHSGNIALGAKSKKTGMVITIWGSELLRTSKKGLRKLEKYYDAAEVIVVESKKMKEVFSQKYSNTLKEKIKLAYFGDGIKSAIDKINCKYSIASLREEFGINPNNIVVGIGYNRNPAHRHVQVIDEILKMPQEVTKNVTIVLPMNYGPTNVEYLAKLDNRIAKFKGKCIKVENYLFGEDYAKIICLLDIFVHAQTTDASSATVRECLYANKILLNGAWLHYDYFDDYNIECVEFEMDNLYEKLLHVLQNIDAYKQKFKYHDVLEEIMDWNNVAKKWNDANDTAIQKAKSK